MSVREKVRSYDERNDENTKMPLRVICKLVSTGLYCACRPADIVPLTSGIEGVPVFFLVVWSQTWDVRKSLTYCRSQRKHGQPSTITNHVQFLTKYSKRLKDKPLCKHYRVNLDLDDLKKARYPRMPQWLTERVLMFSLCCYRRKEMSVNLGLFQTTSNYSWFLCFSCYGFS